MLKLRIRPSPLADDGYRHTHCGVRWANLTPALKVSDVGAGVRLAHRSRAPAGKRGDEKQRLPTNSRRQHISLVTDSLHGIHLPNSQGFAHCISDIR